MPYKLGNRSKERLKGVHPSLIKLIKFALLDSPFDFGIPRDGGARTVQKQKELYSKGRTTAQLLLKGIVSVKGQPKKSKITWTLKSKHLVKSDGYGYAFDLYAYVNGSASWDSKYIDPIGKHLLKCAKELDINLQWGIIKKGQHVDKGHFQLNK